MFIAAVGLASVACEVYHGRLQRVPSYSENPVRRDCQSAGADQRSWIRVRTELPGVHVLVKDADSDHTVAGSTDRDGLCDVYVGAGRWKIEVSMQGWRSARCDLGLAPETVCTVSFDMELIPTVDVKGP